MYTHKVDTFIHFRDSTTTHAGHRNIQVAAMQFGLNGFVPERKRDTITRLSMLMESSMIEVYYKPGPGIDYIHAHVINN